MGARQNPTGEGGWAPDCAKLALLSDEFNSGAYFRSASGELFFGGIRGFDRFQPEQIETPRHLAPAA